MKFAIAYNFLIFIILLFLFIVDISAFYFLQTGLSLYELFVIRFKADELVKHPYNYLWLFFIIPTWIVNKK